MYLKKINHNFESGGPVCTSPFRSEEVQVYSWPTAALR